MIEWSINIYIGENDGENLSWHSRYPKRQHDSEWYNSVLSAMKETEFLTLIVSCTATLSNGIHYTTP